MLVYRELILQLTICSYILRSEYSELIYEVPSFSEKEGPQMQSKPCSLYNPSVKVNGIDGWLRFVLTKSAVKLPYSNEVFELDELYVVPIFDQQSYIW